ncbi:MAG: cation-transporting P-type ATPase, partial [Thiobacillaceae bacterium]
MQIHQQTVEEALARLRSGSGGLSSAEADRRLVEFGPNRIREEHRKSLILGLLKEFTHFFSLVLWLAAGLAFL